MIIFLWSRETGNFLKSFTNYWKLFFQQKEIFLHTQTMPSKLHLKCVYASHYSKTRADFPIVVYHDLFEHLFQSKLWTVCSEVQMYFGTLLFKGEKNPDTGFPVIAQAIQAMRRKPKTLKCELASLDIIVTVLSQTKLRLVADVWGEELDCDDMSHEGFCWQSEKN